MAVHCSWDSSMLEATACQWLMGCDRSWVGTLKCVGCTHPTGSLIPKEELAWVDLPLSTMAAASTSHTYQPMAKASYWKKHSTRCPPQPAETGKKHLLLSYTQGLVSSLRVKQSYFTKQIKGPARPLGLVPQIVCGNRQLGKSTSLSSS